MKPIAVIILIVSIPILYFAIFCNENFSKGERIGTIANFAESGQFFKSFEGHLNSTQTGMTSSTGFDFSIDNDNEPEGLSSKLDSATLNGWKVKLIYHQVKGWNMWKNRGHTDNFVTECIILDKGFSAPNKETEPETSNAVQKNNDRNININKSDTIYIVVNVRNVASNPIKVKIKNDSIK